jgi:hypothetical protein
MLKTRSSDSLTQADHGGSFGKVDRLIFKVESRLPLHYRRIDETYQGETACCSIRDISPAWRRMIRQRTGDGRALGRTVMKRETWKWSTWNIASEDNLSLFMSVLGSSHFRPLPTSSHGQDLWIVRYIHFTCGLPSRLRPQIISWISYTKMPPFYRINITSSKAISLNEQPKRACCNNVIMSIQVPDEYDLFDGAKTPTHLRVGGGPCFYICKNTGSLPLNSHDQSHHPEPYAPALVLRYTTFSRGRWRSNISSCRPWLLYACQSATYEFYSNQEERRAVPRLIISTLFMLVASSLEPWPFCYQVSTQITVFETTRVASI